MDATTVVSDLTAVNGITEGVQEIDVVAGKVADKEGKGEKIVDVGIVEKAGKVVEPKVVDGKLEEKEEAANEGAANEGAANEGAG